MHLAFLLWLFTAKGKGGLLVIAPLFAQWRAFTKGRFHLCYLIRFPMAAPGKSGCDYSHFADEGTEAQRGGQVTKITGLARGPKFLTEPKSHALSHHQSPRSDSPQA